MIDLWNLRSVALQWTATSMSFLVEKGCDWNGKTTPAFVSIALSQLGTVAPEGRYFATGLV